MKIVSFLVWTLMLMTAIVSVMTMMVTFGMLQYSSLLKPFADFQLLEACLAAVSFLWAFHNAKAGLSAHNRRTTGIYFLAGCICIWFMIQGVY